MASFVFTSSGPDVGTVDIAVDKPTGTLIAPVHVFVEAENHSGLATIEGSGTFYDGPYHEYYHYWTIRGDPLPDFTAPANMPSEWRSANKFTGKQACIPLTEPGTYTIDLVVVDKNGGAAVKSTSALTVVSQDAAFSNASTVYVDQTGAFAGVPAAAVKVTSLAEMWAELTANQTIPWRVRLRRGDDYQEDEYLRTSSARRMVHIDSWGNGADPRPIVNISNDPSHTWYGRAAYEIFPNAADKQMSLSGVELRGDWDATTETGVCSNASGIYPRFDSSMNWFLTCHDVFVSGCAIGANFTTINAGGGLSGHMCLVDTTITNWRDYGVYNQGGEFDKIAVIGTAVTQDVDALHGGTARGGSSDGHLNNHGPMRFDDVSFLDLQSCDLFSRSGWSTGGTGHKADQQCLRWNTNGQPDNRMHVARTVMEGGYQIVNMEGENSSAADNPGNHVIEDCALLGSPKTFSTSISNHFGGSTFRNIIGWQPPVTLDGSTPRRLIACFPDNSQNRNANSPIAVHNVSVFNALDTADDFGDTYVLYGGSFNNETVENNIYQFPDGTNPLTASAPVTLSALSGVTPRFKGYRYGFQPVTAVLPAGGFLDNATIEFDYADINRDLTNGVAAEAGGPTDQAYWLTNGGTKHRMSGKGLSAALTADTGGISVSFDVDKVRVTNVSGKDFWTSNGGQSVYLSLDRVALIPAMDTSSDVTGATIQFPMVAPGSPGYQTAAGRVTPLDALGTNRPANPSTGAVEPA